jgi:predicted MFS family arabinose efflux permease
LIPVFLNASLVGYVATVALFGAEFLMPVYLQAFRGRTALEAGFILLAVAATSAITTPLAGRLYDKIGPRMNLVVGFIILCVNTWQLSKIEGNTPISYIIFLLALRGLAVGLALQTSFVAALSSIPLDRLPRAVVGVMPQGFDYPRGTQSGCPCRSMNRLKGRSWPRGRSRPIVPARLSASAVDKSPW